MIDGIYFQMHYNNIKRPIWILLALVVITRLSVALYVYPDVDRLYNGDSAQYEQYAFSLMDTGKYLAEGYGTGNNDPYADMVRPPGLPVTMYLVYSVFGKDAGPWAMIGLSLFANLLVVLLLMWMLRLLSLARYWPVLLFFALDPVWSLYSKELISEPYFAPLMLLAVFTAIIALARLTGREDSLPGLFEFPRFSRAEPLLLLSLSGILMGIAALFKPIMFYGPWAGLLILIAGYFLFTSLRTDNLFTGKLFGNTGNGNTGGNGNYQYATHNNSGEYVTVENGNGDSTGELNGIIHLNGDESGDSQHTQSSASIDNDSDITIPANPEFTASRTESYGAAVSAEEDSDVLVLSIDDSRIKPASFTETQRTPEFTRFYALGCFFAFFFFAQLCIFPWQLRHYHHHQTLTYTSIQAENLMMGHAAFVLAEAASLTHLEAQSNIRERFTLANPNYADYSFTKLSEAKTAVATEILSEHPFLYVKAILRGMIVTLLDPGRLVVERTFGQQDPNEIGLTNTVAKDGVFRTVLRFVGENPTRNLILLLYIGVLGVFLMLSVLGGYRMIKEYPVAALFIISLFVYLLILGGPNGYARFRMYIMPWMVVMAASGTAYLWNYYRAKYQPKTATT